MVPVKLNAGDNFFLNCVQSRMSNIPNYKKKYSKTDRQNAGKLFATCQGQLTAVISPLGTL